MLEAREVSVAFGRNKAVSGASLAVEPGTVVALCGPNGAGKSTLFATMAGDLAPGDGCAMLDGHDVRSFSAADLASRRAVLEQSPTLTASFSVEELVMLPIRREVSPADAAAIVRQCLDRVGLGSRAGDPADRLSGGQRHRAHLARVLAQLAAMPAGEARYLMLDEPTASLDMAHQIVAMQVARQAAGEGVGVLVVLHDLNLAAAFCDIIALMEGGRVVKTAAPADVFTAERLSAVYRTEITVERGTDGALRIMPVYRRAA